MHTLAIWLHSAIHYIYFTLDICFYSLFQYCNYKFKFPLCSAKCLQQTSEENLAKMPCTAEVRVAFETFLNLEVNSKTKSFKLIITWKILPLVCKVVSYLLAPGNSLLKKLTFLLSVLLGCCCPFTSDCLIFPFRYVQGISCFEIQDIENCWLGRNIQ